MTAKLIERLEPSFIGYQHFVSVCKDRIIMTRKDLRKKRIYSIILAAEIASFNISFNLVVHNMFNPILSFKKHSIKSFSKLIAINCLEFFHGKFFFIIHMIKLLAFNIINVFHRFLVIFSKIQKRHFF